MRLATALLAIAIALAPPRAQASDDQLTQAKNLYQLGMSKYDQQRYSDALRDFLDAYKLHQSNDFFYNIAKCYDHMSDFSEAYVHYKKYVDGLPPGESQRA
ncbi:MAG: hypothetical protein EXR72_09615 [Myxococcales bacterium]|nr:hypothetical protein [Myxococcales bacterium]